ncbi:MAG TPA: ribose 5-phosphate isomerase A [Gammaproteobacteria bacterium]|nr:ribose 5-phosphate isomerase A [Gammaproteobacteria bacterium]
MKIEDLKKAAAEAAIAYIEPKLNPDSIVGVGTGSTTNYFIDALGAIRHKFDAAVSSSEGSTARLENLGVRVINLNAAPRVSVYVDGADEVEPGKALIKGGGGALTREKIIAAASEEFVCVVDSTKFVDQLGSFPLPVEVLPMARSFVARSLVELGGDPAYRDSFITDNGNVILDTQGLNFDDPDSLEKAINNIAGVVTNGIFAINRPNTLVMASADGVFIS